VQASSPLTFGPSGTVFPEPGVKLVFSVSAEFVSPPSGFRLAVFKIVNGLLVYPNPKLEIRNPRSETRNSKPKIRNLQPYIVNPNL
jgi:hypothetical protein